MKRLLTEFEIEKENKELEKCFKKYILSDVNDINESKAENVGVGHNPNKFGVRSTDTNMARDGAVVIAPLDKKNTRLVLKKNPPDSESSFTDYSTPGSSAAYTPSKSSNTNSSPKMQEISQRLSSLSTQQGNRSEKIEGPLQNGISPAVQEITDRVTTLSTMLSAQKTKESVIVLDTDEDENLAHRGFEGQQNDSNGNKHCLRTKETYTEEDYLKEKDQYSKDKIELEKWCERLNTQISRAKEVMQNITVLENAANKRYLRNCPDICHVCENKSKDVSFCTSKCMKACENCIEICQKEGPFESLIDLCKECESPICVECDTRECYFRGEVCDYILCKACSDVAPFLFTYCKCGNAGLCSGCASESCITCENPLCDGFDPKCTNLTCERCSNNVCPECAKTTPCGLSLCANCTNGCNCNLCHLSNR
eukprot:Awhi_evm1s9269